MTRNQEPRTLEELLDRIDATAQEGDRVSLREILGVVGRRSYGPLLLVTGLATLAPVVGDIPGVPTILAAIAFLFAVQLLAGRECFWLPRWLLARSVAGDKLGKALGWLRRPARFVDRVLRARLTIFTQGAAVYAIALVCVVIALAMPAPEARRRRRRTSAYFRNSQRMREITTLRMTMVVIGK